MRSTPFKRAQKLKLNNAKNKMFSSSVGRRSSVSPQLWHILHCIQPQQHLNTLLQLASREVVCECSVYFSTPLRLQVHIQMNDLPYLFLLSKCKSFNCFCYKNDNRNYHFNWLQTVVVTT